VLILPSRLDFKADDSRHGAMTGISNHVPNNQDDPQSNSASTANSPEDDHGNLPINEPRTNREVSISQKTQSTTRMLTYSGVGAERRHQRQQRTE
jgi:hypothetical protein